MLTDIVADEEVLYRRVPNHEGNFKFENGKVRVSSAAFGDRKLQPSVDRAYLRENKPENSKLNDDDCVVSLITGDVRSKIGSQVPRIINGVLESCQVDVIADPRINDPGQVDNLAHAYICAKPNFEVKEKNLFNGKFRKALARLAAWEISPEESP